MTLVTGAILPTYNAPQPLHWQLVPRSRPRGPPWEKTCKNGLFFKRAYADQGFPVCYCTRECLSTAWQGSPFWSEPLLKMIFFTATKIYHFPRWILSGKKWQNKKNSWDDEDDEFSSFLLFGWIWLYGSDFRSCSCVVWNVALYLMRSNQLQYLGIWWQKYQYYAMNRYLFLYIFISIHMCGILANNMF